MAEISSRFWNTNFFANPPQPSIYGNQYELLQQNATTFSSQVLAFLKSNDNHVEKEERKHFYFLFTRRFRVSVCLGKKEREKENG